MARLPIVGGDTGNWGAVLNDFLEVSLNGDGTIRPAALVGAGAVTSINAITPQGGNLTLTPADIGAYAKPGSGIPSTDLSAAVQADLTAASTAVQIGGDLGGTATAPTVAKLQGTTVNAASPTANQVLSFVGAEWVPATVSSTSVSDATSTTPGIIQLDGDLGGSATTPEVVGLKGITLPGSAPSANQVLTATSSTATAWSTPATGVQLDASAGDIQADTVTGTAAAGSTGKAADAGHQHALVSHNHTTANQGGQVPVGGLSATGTPSSSTYLRGDGSWSSPPTASNATSSTPGLVQLDGDLGGTATTPSVVGINGITAPTSAPTAAGQVLTATSTTASAWQTASSPQQANFSTSGVVRQTVYNVRDYGAAGNGTTDDTAAINNTLAAANTNGGGTVYLPPATYLISSPLIIFSNTKLQADNATTVNLAPGSYSNMIKNEAVTAQRSVTDAAITSGQATLTSNTANFVSADVGRTVNIAGAGVTSSYPLVANILTVNSSTSVILSVNAGTTVSSANCSVYNRDTNIEIEGGVWNRGTNGYYPYLGGTWTSGPQYNTTWLRHVDGLCIHDLQVACQWRGYMIDVGDVTNYKIRNIAVNGTTTYGNTDGIHVQGPAQGGQIDNVYGVTGDDLVSYTAPDGDGNQADVVGNISDVAVTNLFPNDPVGAAFRFQCCYGAVGRGIACRGIHGSTQGTSIQLAGPSAATTFNVSDVVIENVDVVAGSGIATINYPGNTNGQITFRDMYFRSNLSGSILINVAGGALDNLTVDGFTLENGTSSRIVGIQGTVSNVNVSNVRVLNSSASWSYIVQVFSGVTGVDTVTIRDCTLFKVTSSNPVFNNVNAGVKTVMFDNIYLQGGGYLFQTTSSPSASMQVLANNIVLDSAYQLAAITSTVDMVLTNINVISITQGALIALTTTSAVVSVRGHGLLNPNNVTAFSRDGTQTPRFVHPEMQVDATTIAANNGDTAYNTNSSFSTGVGVIQYSGSEWQTLANFLDTTAAAQTIADGKNFGLGSTTGTEIGTASTQKLGFFGATPVVQQSASTDLGTVLSNLGLRATGTAYTFSTSGSVRFTGNLATAQTTITSNTTLNTTSSAIYQMANASSGAITVTLPSTTAAGYFFTMKKIDSSANVVTVAATIDGATNYSLSSQYQFVTVVSTNVSGTWYIVGAGTL